MAWEIARITPVSGRLSGSRLSRARPAHLLGPLVLLEGIEDGGDVTVHDSREVVPVPA
jgi:hypothetical protein